MINIEINISKIDIDCTFIPLTPEEGVGYLLYWTVFKPNSNRTIVRSSNVIIVRA